MNIYRSQKYNVLALLAFIAFSAHAQNKPTNPEVTVYADSLNSTDAAQTQLIAELYVNENHVIKFEQNAEADTLYLSETKDIGNGNTLYASQLSGSPLEKFLQLTSHSTPVPLALLDYNHVTGMTAVKTQLAINDRTTSNQAVIETAVIPKSLEQTNKAFDAEESCSLPGDNGASWFVTMHCLFGPSSLNHGSSWQKNYCDKEYSSLYRYSTRAVRVAYSRVVNCGTGDAAVIHERRVAGTYGGSKTWFLGDNQIGDFETATKYTNGTRLNRRVAVLKVTPGGHMRSKIVFWKNK